MQVTYGKMCIEEGVGWQHTGGVAAGFSCSVAVCDHCYDGQLHTKIVMQNPGSSRSGNT